MWSLKICMLPQWRIQCAFCDLSTNAISFKCFFSAVPYFPVNFIRRFYVTSDDMKIKLFSRKEGKMLKEHVS
ncbi:hypothetical protein CE164_03005 [Bifidobacterium breve]|nr:hypothetical protein CE164_03005 [Bifidobacterium breve]